MQETVGTEAPEVRLKRLRLRAWHRGIREMDLILGAFADAELPLLPPHLVDSFDGMLAENDHDLYLWVSRGAGPARYDELISRLRAHHGIA